MTDFNNYSIVAAGYGDSVPKMSTKRYYRLVGLDQFQIEADEENVVDQLKIPRRRVTGKSTKLTKLDLEQLSLKSLKTKEIFNLNAKLPYEYIFVSSNSGSLCLGDSGGPISIEIKKRNYVIGVLNIGYPSFANASIEIYCLPKSISVYIPVYPFLNWIGSYVDNICIDKSVKLTKQLHLSFASYLYYVVLLCTLPFTMLLVPYLIIRTVNEERNQLGKVKSICKIDSTESNMFAVQKEKSLEIDDLMSPKEMEKATVKDEDKSEMKIEIKCESEINNKELKNESLNVSKAPQCDRIQEKTTAVAKSEMV